MLNSEELRDKLKRMIDYGDKSLVCFNNGEDLDTIGYELLGSIINRGERPFSRIEGTDNSSLETGMEILEWLENSDLPLLLCQTVSTNLVKGNLTVNKDKIISSIIQQWFSTDNIGVRFVDYLERHNEDLTILYVEKGKEGYRIEEVFVNLNENDLDIVEELIEQVNSNKHILLINRDLSVDTSPIMDAVISNIETNLTYINGDIDDHYCFDVNVGKDTNVLYNVTLIKDEDYVELAKGKMEETLQRKGIFCKIPEDNLVVYEITDEDGLNLNKLSKETKINDTDLVIVYSENEVIASESAKWFSKECSKHELLDIREASVSDINKNPARILFTGTKETTRARIIQQTIGKYFYNRSIDLDKDVKIRLVNIELVDGKLEVLTIR